MEVILSGPRNITALGLVLFWANRRRLQVFFALSGASSLRGSAMVFSVPRIGEMLGLEISFGEGAL